MKMNRNIVKNLMRTNAMDENPQIAQPLSCDRRLENHLSRKNVSRPIVFCFLLALMMLWTIPCRANERGATWTFANTGPYNCVVIFYVTWYSACIPGAATPQTIGMNGGSAAPQAWGVCDD